MRGYLTQLRYRWALVLLAGWCQLTVTRADAGGADTVDPRVDAILTRVEARGDNLKDIECRIDLIDDDQVNLSVRKRTGTIRFMIQEPNPVWLVHFERAEIDGAVIKQEWYLFDGHWLYEVQERIKQVTRIEVVKPGERIDFFDLESAPFPVPFGQKKADILRHFNVTLATPDKKDPAETDHLICVPKTESQMARRFDKVEFFVRRDIDLPSRIIITKNDGYEITTADFPDLSSKSINRGLKARDFEKLSKWKKYDEVEQKIAD